MMAASCFSGIGGAELALPEAHWLWSAEVGPFANAVRSHHFNVPNLGDVLADDFLQRASAYGSLDLLIGGSPCQDFSVAGLRRGLGGARGNLTLRWVQIIHAIRPRYAITENVPGWLSVNNGHAFGAFLAGLVGHDTALLPPKAAGGRWTNAGMVAGPGGRAVWRVLDAQYFGLAQRRQRVFVVFCAGDGPDPAQILLNEPSLRGHPPPRREAGERTAPTLASRATAGGGLGTDFDCDGGLIAFDARNNGTGDVSAPLQSASGRQSYSLNKQPLLAYGGGNTAGSIDVATAVRGHNGSGWHGDFDSETFMAHSLRADGFDASEACSEERSEVYSERSVAVADGTGRGTPLVAQRALVRRLLPIECEKLQGFPPGWTDVPYRGKPAADGPKYRALGNAFAIPVVRWIARRIAREVAA